MILTGILSGSGNQWKSNRHYGSRPGIRISLKKFVTRDHLQSRQEITILRIPGFEIGSFASAGSLADPGISMTAKSVKVTVRNLSNQTSFDDISVKIL